MQPSPVSSFTCVSRSSSGGHLVEGLNPPNISFISFFCACQKQCGNWHIYRCISAEHQWMMIHHLCLFIWRVRASLICVRAPSSGFGAWLDFPPHLCLLIHKATSTWRYKVTTMCRFTESEEWVYKRHLTIRLGEFGDCAPVTELFSSSLGLVRGSISPHITRQLTMYCTVITDTLMLLIL